MPRTSWARKRGKELARGGEEEDATKVKKQPRIDCVGEPDVVVVVGGKKFQEHSKHLCCWSEYFAAAFRSGMRETQTMRFEFPGRNPEDWELLTAILNPFGKEKITIANYGRVLPWCDELLIEGGLRQCDSTIVGDMHGVVQAMDFLSNDGMHYDLPASKAQCYKIIQKACQDGHSAVTKEQVGRLASFLLDCPECKTKLWSSFKKFLPPWFPSEKAKQDALMHAASLQAIVEAEFEKNQHEHELDRLVYLTKTSSRGIHGFARDEICGHLFQEGEEPDYSDYDS